MMVMMVLVLFGFLGGSAALGTVLRYITRRPKVAAWVVVTAILDMWVIIVSADFLIRNSP